MPAWPNLESLSVLFHISSPSGAWYFQGPKGEGYITEGYEITDAMYPPLESTAEDRNLDMDVDEEGLHRYDGVSASFRVKPMDETLVPFLLSFAKAASSMHKLKEAAIWTAISWSPYDAYEGYEEEDFNAAEEIGKRTDGQLAWGIVYAKPGGCPLDTKPGEHSSNARQIWWKVGKWRPNLYLHEQFQQIGVDQDERLIEYWNDDEYGQGLVESRVFGNSLIFGHGNSGANSHTY
jgi:hypothetical protein